jgi:hypothetical protein
MSPPILDDGATPLETMIYDSDEIIEFEVKIMKDKNLQT